MVVSRSFEFDTLSPFVCFMQGITCATSNWPSPSNGYSSCSDVSQVGSGTNCIVTCNHGYRINGPTSSRCGNDGTWSAGSTPNCQGKKPECKTISVLF